MNQEIKAKWVKALLSGRYKQTTEGALHDQCGYCCLGVLCNIYIKETGNAKWEDRGEKAESCGQLYIHGEAKLLPESVMKWAGLAKSDPVVMDEFGDSDPLSEINDRGADFKEIAAKIEADTTL